MEETEVIEGVTLFDWCNECAAVIPSDKPCGHSDLEWMNYFEV